MSRVLAVNVWVDWVYCPAGSVPPPELAEKIGDHAWTDVEDSPGSAGPEQGAHPVAPETGPAEPTPAVVLEPEDEPEDDEPADDDLLPDSPDDVSYDEGGHLPPGLVEVTNDTHFGILVTPAPPLDPGELGPEPPRAGRGASAKVWASYAAKLGIELTGDMGREAIIAAVDARTAVAAIPTVVD